MRQNADQIHTIVNRALGDYHHMSQSALKDCENAENDAQILGCTWATTMVNIGLPQQSLQALTKVNC